MASKYGTMKYGSDIYGSINDITPVYKILVDWNNDGDFTDTYDDITGYVTSCSITRGKDAELGSASCGVMELVLDNSTNLFTPTNTGSAIVAAGDLLPGRDIKCVVYSDSTDYLFTGSIYRITPHPELTNQTCDLFCVDGMEILGHLPVMTALQTDQTSGTVIHAVLTAASWTNHAVDLGSLTIPYAGFFKDIALDSIQAVEQAEQGFFYIDQTGYATFESRYHRWTAAAKASKGIFSNMRALPYKYGLDNVVNHAEVGYSPKAVQASAVIWTLNEVLEIATAADGVISAQYNTLVSAVTTPVATTDFLANTMSNGTGDDITGDMSIAITNYGKGSVVTITNGNENTAYITFFQIRGTALNESYTAYQLDEDSTSITDYGYRGYDFSSDYLDSEYALDIAEFIVAKEHEPRVFKMTADFINKNKHILKQIIQRQLSDRITLTNPTIGLYGDYYINKMTHRISDSCLVHTVVYELEDASYVDGWILGYSTLGTDTVLG